MSLEASCRRILGKADWTKTQCLTPSQVMEGVAMLQEGLRLAYVEEAVRILRSWEWFRRAGIVKPPWEVTEADWERLLAVKPWAPRQEQLDLFA